jgi:ferredoxin-NADP reductase
MLKHPKKKVVRFYSLVVTNFEKWSEEVKNTNLPVHLQTYPKKQSSDEDSLRLYVKRYAGGVMSNYLCSLAVGERLVLKGPFGPGLGIYKLPNGPCLAFAAGTGVLVYLDLVYAIWRKRTNPGFILYLYVTCRSRKESIALDLLDATQKQCRNELKLQINLDEEKIGVRLNKENLKHWIQHDIKKVWICGPPGFNRFIYENMMDYGVDESTIYII